MDDTPPLAQTQQLAPPRRRAARERVLLLIFGLVLQCVGKLLVKTRFYFKNFGGKKGGQNVFLGQKGRAKTS